MTKHEQGKDTKRKSVQKKADGAESEITNNETNTATTDQAKKQKRGSPKKGKGKKAQSSGDEENSKGEKPVESASAYKQVKKKKRSSVKNEELDLSTSASAKTELKSNKKQKDSSKKAKPQKDDPKDKQDTPLSRNSSTPTKSKKRRKPTDNNKEDDRSPSKTSAATRSSNTSQTKKKKGDTKNGGSKKANTVATESVIQATTMPPLDSEEKEGKGDSLVRRMINRYQRKSNTPPPVAAAPRAPMEDFGPSGSGGRGTVGDRCSKGGTDEEEEKREIDDDIESYDFAAQDSASMAVLTDDSSGGAINDPPGEIQHTPSMTAPPVTASVATSLPGTPGESSPAAPLPVSAPSTAIGANNERGGWCFGLCCEMIISSTAEPETKLGSKCFGFCCDLRRAVLIADAVFVAVAVVLLIRDTADANAIVTSANLNQDLYLGVISNLVQEYYNIAVAISSYCIATAFLAQYGAAFWNWCLVLLHCFSLVLYSSMYTFLTVTLYQDIEELTGEELQESQSYASIGLLWSFNVVILYPHIGFIYEMKTGIMTEETLDREDFCCSGRPCIIRM